MGMSLGLAERASDEDIVGAVQWLINKPGARRAMRHAGLALIDGQGSARIAGDLAQALAAVRQPAAVAAAV
jgi:hypothetical protein